MLKDLPKEELELLSHADIAYKILKETKKPLTTPNVFKQVCELLSYNEQQYIDKIGDFYTNLNLDKRFILLDTVEWDLSERHQVKIEIDDEDIQEEAEEELEETIEVEIEEDIDEEIEEDIDEDINELEDLTIVDEEEIE